MVVMPVVTGYCLSRISPGWAKLTHRVGAVLANLTILWIIAVVVALNRANMTNLDARLLSALLCLILGGYLFGYLFGYPLDAVDFFVAAGLAADEGHEVGPGKDRRFVHIPTYAAETGRFTYAVAIEHTSGPEDDALARFAGLILTAYIDRRDRLKDVPSAIGELERLNERFEPLLIGERSGRRATLGCEAG